jgi:hypothetical protein
MKQLLIAFYSITVTQIKLQPTNVPVITEEWSKAGTWDKTASELSAVALHNLQQLFMQGGQELGAGISLIQDGQTLYYPSAEMTRAMAQTLFALGASAAVPEYIAAWTSDSAGTIVGPSGAEVNDENMSPATIALLVGGGAIVIFLVAKQMDVI